MDPPNNTPSQPVTDRSRPCPCSHAGGIGAKRFCSSKDLGNYCNYVTAKGDVMEYRSCIFTCGTDGCNAAPVGVAVSSTAVIAAMVGSWLVAVLMH